VGSLQVFDATGTVQRTLVGLQLPSEGQRRTVNLSPEPFVGVAE